MAYRAQQTIRDWKAADQIARSAELRMKFAWAAFDTNRGPPPSKELMEEVDKARALACALLNEAIRLMAEASSQCDYRPGGSVVALRMVHTISSRSAGFSR